MKHLVTLALQSGMRRGELFKLKWRDVDFDRGLITIRASVTKNRKRRTVRMNSTVKKALSEWFDQVPRKVEHVFTYQGKPLQSVKRSFATLMRKAEIEGIGFHDLRHCFASKKVMSGVSLYEVKELLGHSSIKMTERYPHLAPDYMADVAEVGAW